MFVVQHLNFDNPPRRFPTLEEARADVVRVHFEAVIYSPTGERVASWSPIGGWR